MKFEVKNNQFHINGKPVDSEMEIGIAIKKELKQGEAVLRNYVADVNKLASMVELKIQYEIANDYVAMMQKKHPTQCMCFPTPDSMPRVEFRLLDQYMRMAAHHFIQTPEIENEIYDLMMIYVKDILQCTTPEFAQINGFGTARENLKNIYQQIKKTKWQKK